MSPQPDSAPRLTRHDLCDWAFDRVTGNGVEKGTDPTATHDVSLAAGLWREHLPLFVTVLSTLFVAIRVLSAAGYDPETAYALLQGGGAASVILGAALASVGQIALAIFLVSAERYFFHPESVVIERRITMVILVISGVASIFAAPAFMVLFLALIVILYFVLAYVLHPFFKWLLGFPSYEEERAAISDALLTRDPELMKRTFGDPEKRRRSEVRVTRTAIILVSLSLVYFALTSGPWMPAEELNVRGSQPVVGYVISSDVNEVIVLLVSNRTIQYIDTPKVINRRVCDAGGLPPPLPDLLPGHPSYPPCPRPDHYSDRHPRRAKSP